MTTLIPKLFVRKIAACLGDSLTANKPTGGRCWDTHADRDLFPRIGCANFGKSGNTTQSMLTRYNNSIKGVGYHVVVCGWGINNIVQGHTVADTWAAIESVVNDSIARLVPVVLIVTSPAGNLSGFTPTMQTKLLELRALILAKTHALIFHVDLYAGMGSASDPTKLDAANDSGDGLHWSATGTVNASALIAPQIAAALATTQPAITVIDSFGTLATDATVLIDAASLSGLEISVSTPAGIEVIFDSNGFGPNYSGSSLAPTDEGGQRLSVRRSNGWPDGELVLDF